MSILSSLFGGGETTTTSTGTQSTQVAKPYSHELDLLRTTSAGLMPLLQGLGQDQSGLFQQMFQAYLNPALQNISQTYETAGNQMYQNAASRGLAGSSRQQAGDQKLASMQAQDVGQATQQAVLNAFQSLLADEANRRANIASLLQGYQQQYLQRLQRSTVTTSGTNTTNEPMNIFGTLGQGVGTYLALK